MTDLLLHIAPADQVVAGNSNRWLSPELSLLGDGRRPAPQFPLVLLDSFWADWIIRAAEAASAPVDYIALSLLTSASALIANARWPLAGAGWKEPPILWGALVGSPSSGKSPALDAVFDLIRHLEDQMAIGFEDELRKHQTAVGAANARRDQWEQQVKAAIKGEEEPPPFPDDAKVPAEVVRPRIRVSDCTTEKLGALAAAHERGLLLVRDELSGWFGSFDKYTGGGSDRAFAIEMYGGRSYAIDRMKNSTPLMIPRLSVSVVGGIQPDKLPALISGPDDGLISRILWCWPGQDEDFQLCREAPDYSAAQAALQRLLQLPLGTDEFGSTVPIILNLTPEAEQHIEEFSRQMKRAGLDACGPVAGALGKARGHTLRLAAVLEHLWWCASGEAQEPKAVSGRAVLAAAALMEDYFLPMASRVFGDSSIPQVERNAIFVIKALRKNWRHRFNSRDLRREIGGPVRESKDMDAACVILEEAGLIRATGKSTGSRPRKDFEVNPAVFEGVR